ncbi:MAG: TolC family protein, partial [Desulfobacterales bacterium]|nr:TolC family protein [Desulfobacterales bacterium]
MKKYMFQTILILMCLYGPAQGSPTQADLTDTATGRYLAEANLNPEKLDSTQAPVTLLTLARAKQTALENSPTLAAARERVAQAVEAIAQAQADYMPTIGLN